MEPTRRAGTEIATPSVVDLAGQSATISTEPPPLAAHSAPQLSAGSELLGGRFVINGLMGEGGMGIVYDGLDRERGEAVAIKTLVRASPKKIYRLKNEFRALAGVVHPNLVRLHELFVDDDRWYFSMELVEGRPFHRYVRPDGVLDEARLRAVLPQLRDAIIAIHAAGKLHRDLKPSNVLVTAEGRVVVLDFGLALDPRPTHDPDTHEQGFVEGTPAYMAPEQAAALPMSEASDYYAMGVMLFEALTGELPFDGHGNQVLREKHERPAPRASTRALVPPDLDALCAELLSRAPALRPGAAALEARLGASPAMDGAPRSRSIANGRLALIGRDRELAELREAAFAARDRERPVVVLLSGESGIGKSALAGAFLDEVSERHGAVVLAGRCYEREAVPYKAFDAVIDALSRYLGRIDPRQAAQLVPGDAWALRRLFPVLSRAAAIAVAPEREIEIGDAQEARRRGFLALGEMLARIAQSAPLVLYIDDLQWTDADSMALLLHVLRRPDAPRLLFLLAHRSDAGREHALLREVCDALAGDIRLDVRALRLGPLAPEAAEALARRHGAAHAAEIAREAAGNPFLLGELSRRAPSQAGGGASLSTAVRARVSLLSERERTLLEVLSIAARPIPLSLAADALDMREGTHAAMDVLQAARLARSSFATGSVECYHDRIREAVATGLPEPALRARHHALASALARRDDSDPEQLFTHYEQAGDAAQSVRYALDAARHAERTFAFERAAGFYDRALALGDFTPAQRDALQLSRASALSHAGRGPEAADVYLRVAEHADFAARPDLEQKAAEQLLMSGHLERGHALLVDALDALDVKLPRGALGAVSSLLYRRARLRLRGLDSSPRSRVRAQAARQLQALLSSTSALSRTDALFAAEAAARYLLMALREGGAVDVARALVWEVLFSTVLGASPEQVRSVVARARALCVQTGDLEALAALHRHHGFFLYINPDPDLPGALRELDASLALYREHALPTSLYDRPWGEWNRANVRGYLGHYADVARELPAHLHEAWSRADLCIATMWAAMVLPRLAIGDAHSAERDLERARRAWSQSGFTLQDLSLLQADYHMGHYRGDARAVYERIEQDVARLDRSPLHRGATLVSTMQGLRAGTAAALAMNARGAERARLVRTVRAGARALQRTVRSNWIGRLALPVHATAEWLDGNREQALSELRQSLAQLAPIPSIAEVCRRHLGSALGGDEGRELVRQADAFLHGHGVVDTERFACAVMPGWTV